MLFNDSMMGAEFWKAQNLLECDKNLAFLWKFSIWGYTSLKTSETDLEIYFAVHILGVLMKSTPVAFF